MKTLDYVVMVAFLLAICVMGGVLKTRRSRTKGEADEHMLAGGHIPSWAAAISYVMALFSTHSLVSTPGEAYNYGLRKYVLEWIGPFTGLLFFFIFMRFYFTVKTFTPFAYLERRFDARVRGICSGIYLLTRVTVLAIILFSCATVFEAMAGWPVWVTSLVVGTVSILYSAAGGMKAVIWTHVLQFAVMIIGIGSVVVVCSMAVEGGPAGVISYAFEHDRGFNFDRSFFSIDPHERVSIWWMLIVSTFAFMFYNSSDQIAIQQLLSTSSYKAARRSFITSTCIFVPLGALLWFLGLAVWTFFQQHPLPGGNPPGDKALFTFIVTQTPQPIPGLMASAALSAATSVLGSMIMSLSTVATKDFYVRFHKPEATDQQQVRFTRQSTVALGIMATVLAIIMSFTAKTLNETLMESNTIWGSLIAVVPPVFFVGVMSRRATAKHVLGAMAFGVLLTSCMLVWYVISKIAGRPISFLIVSMPGFVGAILFGLLSPYVFGKRPPAEKLDNLTLFTLRPSEPTAAIAPEPARPDGMPLAAPATT